MEGPVCLVEVTPSGSLRLNAAGLQILRSLDTAVEVVAIFGPKDTGKSFLVNQMTGEANGFRLSGPGAAPSSGIWISCLTHPMNRSHSLVLLDTEGFGDEEEQKTFAMLFLLDILTCSVFIYNTRGTMGLQEELEQLNRYMSEVTQRVCVDSLYPEDTSLLLLGLLPEFVCCMRDVPVDPVMEEQMLAVGNSLDSAFCHAEDLDTDAPLVGYRLFPTRKLFHFCPPCPDAHRRDLEMVPTSQLDPCFHGQVGRFRDYVLSRATKNTLGNRRVSGRILAGFLEHYVDLLSREEVIILSDLCDLFEEEISGFQQVASNTSPEGKKAESPGTSNVHLQPPVLTAGPAQIREVWQPMQEPRLETVIWAQNAAPSGPSPAQIQVRQRQGKAAALAMEEPMCFIENMPGGCLQVNQEALRFLSRITQPVVVVAIVGLYRTGKSYLMNKLAGKQSGFSLGSTIQSHTKGIWMWCVPHPQKPDHTLVLLDTEGLGDVEKGDSKNDSWIFALAVLLSSTFVYNSMGTIDYHALEQLHYVTELTERIKVKSTQTDGGDEDSEFLSFFPAFVWAVRDFTLQLILDGQPITEDEYLENALKLSQVADAKTNMPKQYIRRYFPSRKCFVFDCPTSKKNLAVIETLREDQLEPDFVKQAQRFCCHIHGNSNTKTIKGGHIVTGTLLGNLAVTYVDAIRSGAIPCMENAVLALAQIENSAAVQEACTHYTDGMEKAARGQFPTETLKEFMFLHNACEKEALQVFIDRSFKDDDQQFLEELARQLEAKRQHFHQRNDQASSDHCVALLLEDQENMDEGSYATPGGYQRFLDAQRDMVARYNQTPGKGLKAEQVLHEVLKSQETMAQTILQVDNALTQKEKEVQEERARTEALAREARVRQEMQEQAEQMLANQQRAHEEHTRQVKQKMEADQRQLQREQDMVISRKLQEQECLLREGFNRESARLAAEIQKLRQQIPKPKPTCVIS